MGNVVNWNEVDERLRDLPPAAVHALAAGGLHTAAGHDALVERIREGRLADVDGIGPSLVVQIASRLGVEAQTLRAHRRRGAKGSHPFNVRLSDAEAGTLTALRRALGGAQPASASDAMRSLLADWERRGKPALSLEART